MFREHDEKASNHLIDPIEIIVLQRKKIWKNVFWLIWANNLVIIRWSIFFGSQHTSKRWGEKKWAKWWETINCDFLVRYHSVTKESLFSVNGIICQLLSLDNWYVFQSFVAFVEAIIVIQDESTYTRKIALEIEVNKNK